MTITPITSSYRISAGKRVADRNPIKTEQPDEVAKRKRIESSTYGILKKNENSPEKGNHSPEKDTNQKYSKFSTSTPHAYITKYTQYKNASNDEERIRLLSSFSKDVQLYIVVNIPNAIQYTPPFVQEDLEFVLAAVKQNGLILEYLSDYFKSSFQIVAIAFDQNPYSLRYALCQSIVPYQNGLALQYASDVIQDNKATVLTAIRQNRTAFVYASERLRKDQDIIDAVSEPSFRSIHDIPENMREDKETLLKLLRENGLEFEHIPEKYKTDLEIVLTALRQNYHIFKYLSDDLQNHSSVTNIAISQDYTLLKYLNKENAIPHIINNGLLIQYLSDSLKKDKSLAIVAIQQNKGAFQYFDSSLQNDPEIIKIYRQPDIDFPNASIEIRSNKIAALAAVRRNGLFLKYVDATIQDDSTIIFAALQQNSLAFQYLQRPRILQLLNQEGWRLKYAGALRGDLEVVGVAVRQNGLALEYAVAPARNHETILLQAMLQNRGAFHFFPDTLKNNQKFLVKCLKLDPSIIEFVPKTIWNDREFILEAVSENGMVLEYLQNDKWIEDDEIVHKAIEQNRWAIEFAPDGIRTDQKYREKIERSHFLKYDKQIILDTTCKTTAIALTWKMGAVAGQVPTKIIPVETPNTFVQMDFSEGLSYKSRIYLIGHCNPGQDFLLSDIGLSLDVETVTAVVRYFFVNTERKKNQKVKVSLVGCYSGMSFDNDKSFAEKLSLSLDKASIPAEVVGRLAAVHRAPLDQVHQHKKIVDRVHKEPGMTVMFSTENGKTTMHHRYLDNLSITKDTVEFPNFGTLFKNISRYEIDLLVDGRDEILKKVASMFHVDRNSATGRFRIGQWFFGKHPTIKNQKTIWFTNALGNVDYARGGYSLYLQDHDHRIGDFDVYVLAHYLKKCELKPENAIVQFKKL